jgi:hypothetical protein
MFHGKINYFYGHFQQQTVDITRGYLLLVEREEPEEPLMNQPEGKRTSMRTWGNF